MKKEIDLIIKLLDKHPIVLGWVLFFAASAIWATIIIYLLK